MISYKDIEEARASVAGKEVIKGQGKTWSERKSAVLEADELTLELEPELEVARMIEKPEQSESTRAMEGTSSADDPSAGCGE